MAQRNDLTTDWDANGTVASGATIIQCSGASPIVVGQGTSQPSSPLDGTVLAPGHSVTVADAATYWLRKASELPATASIAAA